MLSLVGLLLVVRIKVVLVGRGGIARPERGETEAAAGLPEVPLLGWPAGISRARIRHQPAEVVTANEATGGARSALRRAGTAEMRMKV